MPPKKKSKVARKSNDTSFSGKRKKFREDHHGSESSSDASDEYRHLNGRIPQKRTKGSYPQKMIINFKRLELSALRRYASFYQLDVSADVGASELAVHVARHFDSTLEVDEEESICCFVRTVRNGEAVGKNNNLSDALRKKASKDSKKRKKSARKRQREEVVGEECGEEEEDVTLYCVCSRPSYGDMIACDGKTCPDPSQWYHLACVGIVAGDHPDTWLCPHCDPKSGDSSEERPGKKGRSRSPGSK